MSIVSIKRKTEQGKTFRYTILVHFEYFSDAVDYKTFSKTFSLYIIISYNGIEMQQGHHVKKYNPIEKTFSRILFGTLVLYNILVLWKCSPFVVISNNSKNDYDMKEWTAKHVGEHFSFFYYYLVLLLIAQFFSSSPSTKKNKIEKIS